MTDFPPPTYRQPPTSRVELWSNPTERKKFEEMAELYAILRTTELLEVAYSRDDVETSEYTEACQRLITQYKTTEKALIQSGSISSLDSFVQKYNMDCPRAVTRMILGYPENSGIKVDDRKEAMVMVKDITELFLYCSNLISLNRRAVDELYPQLEDLVRALNRAKNLLRGFDCSPLEEWLKVLQKMKASDELNDDQSRQLLHDLNTAKASADVLLNS